MMIVFKYEQEFKNKRINVTTFDELWMQGHFDQTELLCNEYKKSSARDLSKKNDNRKLSEKVQKLHERHITEKRSLH